MRAAPALGSLNERVELFSKVTGLDEGGGQETEFVSIGTAWARILSRASRGEAGDAIIGEATHEVVLRHRSDISAGDRVAWRGRALEVIGREDFNGRRAYLLLRARETEVAG